MEFMRQKKTKKDLIVGEVCYGVRIVEVVDCRTVRVICPCGIMYSNAARNLRRNSDNVCPVCNKLARSKILKKGRDKAEKVNSSWKSPETRHCKSCLEEKPYGEFPPKRHTCKKCSNIGRMAYYYNNTEEKE